MGKDSEIAWTHHTFNPWWGCTRVSPGCTHCYAESFAKRTGHKVWGTTSPRRFFDLKHHAEPIKWNARAAKAGVRERVFCASMADVFERVAGDVGVMLDAERARLWTTIEATPSLDWLLLTKRPENMRAMVPASWLEEPRANVWFGTTCEDQRRADERLHHLLAMPAAIRFVSAEPLLGRVNFGLLGTVPRDISPGYQMVWERLHWIIVGGESGAGARPFALDWAREIVEECAQTKTACFVKQLGARPVEDLEPTGEFRDDPESGARQLELQGRLVRLRDRKGGDLAEFPADLQVRQFPGATA